MSASLFWGLILILIGISIIIKIVFNIEFSIFRVVIALIFIYFGIRIFIGHDFSFYHDNNDEHLIMFSKKIVDHIDNEKEYNVIFGDGVFDLRKFSVPDSEVVHIKLNTIFAGTEIIMTPEIPVEISTHTVFGGTKMPNSNASAFGEATYKNATAKNTKARIFIETNTIFGGLQVRE